MAQELLLGGRVEASKSSWLWIDCRTEGGPSLQAERLGDGSGARVERVTSLTEAQALLEATGIGRGGITGVALAIESKADGSGKTKAIAAIARSVAGRIPILAVVPKSQDIVDALTAGADDACTYATPPDEVAARLMAGARERKLWADISRRQPVENEYNALRQDYQRLRELAHRDELTGIGNRRELQARYDELVPALAAEQRPLSVLMIDLDGMKALNDIRGHAEGDAALVRVAGIVQRSIREFDVGCRLGGDEFAVLMPGTSAVAAARAAERIRRAIGAMRLAGGMKVTASIGLATFQSGEAVEMEDLLRRADRALYTAKRAGKNRVEIAGQRPAA